MESLPVIAAAADFAAVLQAVRNQTQALLACTISFDEEKWALPTRHPGWTRSHVASHLIAGARAMLRVCASLKQGTSPSPRLYDSFNQRRFDIEYGALADGMALQVGLDATSGQLLGELPALAGNHTSVRFSPRLALPADQLPVARLYEVVTHGYELAAVHNYDEFSSDLALTLLEHHCKRMAARTQHSFRLLITDGPELIAKAPKATITKRGTTRQLLHQVMCPAPKED